MREVRRFLGTESVILEVASTKEFKVGELLVIDPRQPQEERAVILEIMDERQLCVVPIHPLDIIAPAVPHV